MLPWTCRDRRAGRGRSERRHRRRRSRPSSRRSSGRGLPQFRPRRSGPDIARPASGPAPARRGTDRDRDRGAPGVTGEPAGMLDHPDAALVPAATMTHQDQRHRDRRRRRQPQHAWNTAPRPGSTKGPLDNAVDHLIIKPLDVRLHDTIQSANWRHRCPASTRHLTVGNHQLRSTAVSSSRQISAQQNGLTCLDLLCLVPCKCQQSGSRGVSAIAARMIPRIPVGNDRRSVSSRYASGSMVLTVPAMTVNRTHRERTGPTFSAILVSGTKMRSKNAKQTSSFSIAC